ncbi:MAG: threonine synthase [Hyphomicrobiales bacterium]|nr:threonine synthase [Hyphomicrobiales bacterium]
MKYISTRGQADAADFESVLLSGLASDGGLYMPEAFPSFSAGEIKSFRNAPYADVAFACVRKFVDDSWSDGELRDCIDGAYSTFDDAAVTPLRELAQNEYLLELFHGPTFSFKDVAMQLLSRLFATALRRRKSKGVTIVVATSGDTGAAAMHAFRGMEGINVFVLYPNGRISEVQRRQMTTPQDSNVHAIAIDGSFDDCQALVKQCFADASLRTQLSLTGVNSINWARIMAQTVYYVVAAARLGAPDTPVRFCVPTGNFGNIFAGYVCKKMGLPITRLNIATNENDILVRTFRNGVYRPRKVIATCAPSMDIQVASNFERLLFELRGRNSHDVRDWMKQLREAGDFTIPELPMASMRSIFEAGSADQSQIFETIKTVFEQCGVEVDPHTAVGIHVGRQLAKSDSKHPGVILSTAHPAKFPDTRLAETKKGDLADERIKDIMNQPERLYELPASKKELETFLLERTR